MVPSNQPARRDVDRGAAPWPALTYEELEWTPRTSIVPASRRTLAASTGPYRAAIVPPIANAPTIPLSNETLVEAGDAAVEIGRFDGAMGTEIAPFLAILLRSESAASSKIERLTASARAIALAELGDKDRTNATSIVSNTRVMQAAISLANALDGDSILAMHASLLEGEHPDWAGRWREQQVWIGGSNYSPHRAAFVPPHHSHVRAAINDLVDFMARDDLPPLVQAAIAHAQFETIHPFPDGNGRVGRALVHSILRAKGLTKSVVVPVSAGLLTDTDSYFAALTAYREGNPQVIVEQFTAASFWAINAGTRLVSDLREIRGEWSGRVSARSDSAVWRLADLLIRQPIVSTPLLETELGVTATNSLAAIDRLVTAGVLDEISGSRRNRRWEAKQVLVALDAFAARTARRG